MRKWLAVALSVAGILGFLAPTADAQAPKVTINGLVDQISSWSRNMSIVDTNFDRTDSEWYARTRVRPDITAEVGTTKFVLGLEIDLAWGQWGERDTAACIGSCPTNNTQRSGSNGGYDLNTDVAGIIEVKWAYTEFDVPWVPGSRIRLGAQPWQATYKLATLANGDYAGVHWSWAITPAIRTHVTYAQIEEQSQESRSLFPGGLRPGGRQEDFAFVTSVEITPFKGLDIRPIYSYARYDGGTNIASRQGRGGVSAGASGALPGFNAGDIESRHTIGVDARLRLGPVSIDPTVFYQFGSREVSCPAVAIPGCSGSQQRQDLDAWLIDLRAGFQAGPLLIEGAFIYVTGNDKDDNLRDNVNYYQPISTDTSYYAGWANIFALGIDYFNIMYSGASGLNPGVAIGYDKYGMVRLGARANYALTPTFNVYTNLTQTWTAESVDTNATLNAGGLTRVAGVPSDSHRNLGFEVNIGTTWRLAPNLAFDLVGGYLFSGAALSHASAPKEEDVKTIASRFRFTF